MTRPHSLAYRVGDRLDVFAPAVSLAGPDCHGQEQQQVSTCSSKFTCDRRTTAKHGGCVVNAAYNNHRGEPGSQSIRQIPLIRSGCQSFSLTLSGNVRRAVVVTLILTETSAPQSANGRKQDEQESHRFLGTDITGSMSGVPIIGVSSSDTRRTSQADRTP